MTDLPLFEHNYELTSISLGEGTFANVYLGKDKKQNVMVACKIPKLSTIFTCEGITVEARDKILKY